MEYRNLGRTGLRVSALGFGCGAVGGLIVKGDAASIDRAIRTAIDAGITYFDTAQLYGNGLSETNLGASLQRLKPAANVIVGSKVQLRADDFANIEQAIVDAAEVSLRRMQREALDLFQLHNGVAGMRDARRNWVGLDDLPAVTRGFERLVQAGKIKHWGINGLGETAALHSAVDALGAESIQCCYNLLNPSAGRDVAAGFPFQNYGRLMQRAAARGMGVIAIRVLAAGALAGTAERHALAMQRVDPIATSATLEEDVALAKRFEFLVRDGEASSLAGAAIRFAISQPLVSTALVGVSSQDHLEQAIAAARQGPLSAQALAAVAASA